MVNKKKIWKWTKKIIFVVGLVAIFEEIGHFGVVGWFLIWVARPIWNLFNNRHALKAALDYHQAKTDLLKMQYKQRKKKYEE